MKGEERERGREGEGGREGARERGLGRRGEEEEERERGSEGERLRENDGRGGERELTRTEILPLRLSSLSQQLRTLLVSIFYGYVHRREITVIPE